MYSSSSPHTRNVFLKCRHSVLSIIRYDAAAGHVVLVECHRSFIVFNDSGCTTVRCGVVGRWGGSKYTFLEPPGAWY